MKKISSGVNKRIREVRKEQNMTQEQFASILGITPQYLSLLETEARNPSYCLLLGILYKFGGDEDWLVNGR